MQLSSKRKTALIAFIAFDILVVAFFIYLFLLRGERQNQTELREIGVTIYPEARALSDFQLIDEQGDAFTKNDLQGHWNLMFFGFTHCPDICPLTMAELRQFYQALEVDENDKPRIFLVTVDPERDDPETMKAYLDNYNADFIGLTGDAQVIAHLASELYVVYSEADDPDTTISHDHNASSSDADMVDDGYLVNHSGHIAVINPEGDYYAVMRAPHRDRDLTAAYLQLIK